MTVPSDAAAAEPTVAAPPSDLGLGPDLTLVAHEPGRYATAVQRTLQGIHAQQVLSVDATSAFVLELGADGNATACRGWRYTFHNDGPRIQTGERFREQQGYRGRFTVHGGIVELELHADDTVCPAIREHGDVVPRRATALRLRCVRVEPRGHAALTAPALLCQWNPVDVPSPELDAQVAPGIVPERWMVLGGGDGLRLKVTGMAPGSRVGDPLRSSVLPSSTPVGLDAWERSF